MAEDLRRYFAIEARELVAGLTQGALQIERSGTLPPEQRKHLLRLAHTLKGAARVVRESAIADEAHALEDLISSSPDEVEPGFASRLLTRVDAISSALPVDEGTATGAATGTGPADEGRSVRVDLSAVDGALERVAHISGRCAILRDELAASASELPRSARHAVGALETLAAEVGQLRSQLHEMRLAPASVLFLPLERAVHDTAQAGAVRARFEGSGGEVRMDADVLMLVRGALIQLVRNAIAHGIEPPSERLAAGKPPEGVVRLAVERRGTGVAFVLSDDGRGLDVTTLRHAVRKAGVVDAASIDRLAEHELIPLLFEGGVTSQGSASQISGRGVGLDLVRSTVAQLSGQIAFETQPGRGVKVELLLPVSLRSLRYVRLETAEAAALLPLDAVRGTARLSPTVITEAHGRPHAIVGDRLIPVIGLQTILDGSAQLPQHSRDRVAVVMSAGEQVVAISAERFGEAGTAIAQALPPLAAVSSAIRGIAVDDAARIVPVLDAEAIAALLLSIAPPAAHAPHRIRRVLVVDDSITTRMLEQSILEAAGYEVHTAASAEEALGRAADGAFDLFIVDVEMPGMNGFEFVAATRAEASLARTPSILVTSRSAESDRRRGLAAGASAYIVKGEFDQEVFLNTVRGLVG